MENSLNGFAFSEDKQCFSKKSLNVVRNATGCWDYERCYAKSVFQLMVNVESYVIICLLQKVEWLYGAEDKMGVKPRSIIVFLWFRDNLTPGQFDTVDNLTP